VSGIASLQRLDASLSGMSSIEALLGEPDGSGIGGRINDVFARLSDLSASPEDRVLRTGVTQSLSAMTAKFHEIADDLSQAASDSNQRVVASVEEVNSLADRIVALNREIGKLEALGGVASDMRDQRDEALRALAAEIDISYHEDDNGEVRVFVDGQLLVGSEDKKELVTRLADDGSLEVWIDGSTAQLHPHGGHIGGLLDHSSGFVFDLRTKMDRLARSLILEMHPELGWFRPPHRYVGDPGRRWGRSDHG
jgi:flagellar hook-associated protein 1 FlgK